MPWRPSISSIPHNESDPMSPATAELAATELYRGPLTFMGAPFSHDLSTAKAAILGAPFDCGTHLFRIGARQGPQSIREQSRLIRPFQSELADYDICERLGLVDCGDAAVTPGRIGSAFALIEEAAWRIVSAGTVPIGFGGDGSISLPLIRAAARQWPNLAVLHVDSHTDAYPYDESEPYTAATQFTHAALEQRIAPSASYHVGLRGSTYCAGVHEHARRCERLSGTAYIRCSFDPRAEHPGGLSRRTDGGQRRLGRQPLSRPPAAEGGGRRPAFTAAAGPAILTPRIDGSGCESRLGKAMLQIAAASRER